MVNSTLREKIQVALGRGESPSTFQSALEELVQAFGAVTATLHRAEGETLHLVASRGLPEKILSVTGTIPFGKGMAGICAVRRQPVTMCNLQTDASGVARPGARQTDVQGAIVVPLFVSGSDTLVGTLGIGKSGEYTYTPEEEKLLSECAGLIAATLVPSSDSGSG